jgi:PBP1b-binding outer membrane lipoprotein LpoB
MKKLKIIFTSFIVIMILSGCQTIKQKTDAIVEKENQKLSKYIGKSSSVLQIDLGKPDEDFKNEKGNLVFVYNTKKYGIPCERRFEVDSNSVVVGFVSNGCF